MFHKKLKINLPCVYPCSVTQLHPTLCDSKDCSLPDSSMHGIYSPRILKWVAISSFRKSFQRRDRTCISCIGRKTHYHWATWESLELLYSPVILLLDIYLENSKGCTHSDVHCNTIYNIQNMEITNVSAEGWTKKLWYKYIMDYSVQFMLESSSSSQGVSLKGWAVSADNDTVSDSHSKELHVYCKVHVLFYTLTKALGQRFDILSFPHPYLLFPEIIVVLKTEFLL